MSELGFLLQYYFYASCRFRKKVAIVFLMLPKGRVSNYLAHTR